MKKMITALFLVACAHGGTNAYAYELTDVRAKAIVVADVLTEKCGAVHRRGRDVFVRYRKAASKLLSVATVESTAYARRYRELSDVVNGLPPAKLDSDCDEMIPRVEAMIPEMELDYRAYLDILDADQRSQADAWRNALEAIGSIANAFGQAAQASFPIIPIPSGRVTYAQPRSGNYSHYLVNTPGGQRLCHVASSGYIFCS